MAEIRRDGLVWIYLFVVGLWVPVQETSESGGVFVERSDVVTSTWKRSGKIETLELVSHFLVVCIPEFPWKAPRTSVPDHYEHG
jgi:hypothetical protein